MHITIQVTVDQVSTGIRVSAPSIGLSDFAGDKRAALNSLRQGVRAWCLGLYAQGHLEGALERRGISWTPSGAELLVELEENPAA